MKLSKIIKTMLLKKTKFLTLALFSTIVMLFGIMNTTSCKKKTSISTNEEPTQYTLTLYAQENTTIKAFSDEARTIEITDFSTKFDKDTKIYLTFSYDATQQIEIQGIDEGSLNAAKTMATVTMTSDKLVSLSSSTPPVLFTVSNGAITGYTGTEPKISIPGTINGVAITSIGKDAFKGNKTITEVIIPDGVTIIGENAFINCTNLTTVVCPNTLTSLNSLAFGGTTSLKTITLPSSLRTIGANAFQAAGLTSIDIPEGVTTIESSAFSANLSLEKVTIPSTIKSIGVTVFVGNLSLSEVTVKATTPPTAGFSIFLSTSASLKIKVPSASVNAYKTASNWSDYASKIEGY